MFSIISQRSHRSGPHFGSSRVYAFTDDYVSREEEPDDRGNFFGYLEHAMKGPKRCYNIGVEQEGIDAVKRLEKIGLVEISYYSNHYRINPKF
jgi:hypothetical protein